MRRSVVYRNACAWCGVCDVQCWHGALHAMYETHLSYADAQQIWLRRLPTTWGLPARVQSHNSHSWTLVLQHCLFHIFESHAFVMQ